MNAIFYDDCILAHFEKKEQWEEEITYLKTLMFCNPDNPHILYRFAAQCWYVLTFWNCTIANERLNRNEFVTNLKISYLKAKELWWNESDALWLFGYFMCINQFDFLNMFYDIIEVEKEGCELIHKAFSLDPDNQLAKVMYLADNSTKDEYSVAKQQLRESIQKFFPGHSRVDLYFADIFTSSY